MARPDRLSRELVDLAMDLHRARPWRYVEADAPFLVRGSFDGTALAFVVGQIGEEPGLSVLWGDGAERDLERLLEASRSWVPRWSDYLMLTYEPWAALPSDQRAWLTAAGLSVRREAAAPAFLALTTSGDTRIPNRAQMRVLAQVLRAILLADAAGVLQPRELGPRRRVLELALEGHGRTAHVVDRIVPLPRSEAQAGVEGEEIDLPGRERGDFEPLPRNDARWIVGTLLVSGYIESEGEPVSVEFLAVLDAVSGRALTGEVVPTGDARAAAEALAQVLRGESRSAGGAGSSLVHEAGVPRDVIFADEWLHERLGPALQRIGVHVHLDTENEIFGDFADAFDENFGSHVALADDDLEPQDLPEDDDFEGWKRADLEVSELIFEGVPEQIARGAALARYFGSHKEAQRLMPVIGKSGAVQPLVEWFTFEFRPQKRSLTRAEKLLADPDLGPRARAVLEARRNGVVSIFRVVSTEPGASTSVENLVDGSRYVVHDRSLANNSAAGMFLCLRIYPVGPWNFATVTGPVIPPWLIEPAMSLVMDATKHAGAGGSIDAGRDGLGRLWALLTDTRQRPRLVNKEGDELVFLRARFRASDEATLVQRLEEREDMERIGDSSWHWLDLPRTSRGRSHQGSRGSRGKRGSDEDPAFGNSILATLELFGDELVAEVNSEARLERLRFELLGIPGITFEDVHEIEGTAPDDRSSGVPPPRDPVFEAEMALRVRAMSFAWLDQPVPAFGGRTPREAYRDPEQRATVERFVRTFPDSQTPWGPIEVPRDELLADLRQGRGPK